MLLVLLGFCNFEPGKLPFKSVGFQNCSLSMWCIVAFYAFIHMGWFSPRLGCVLPVCSVILQLCLLFTDPACCHGNVTSFIMWNINAHHNWQCSFCDGTREWLCTFRLQCMVMRESFDDGLVRHTMGLKMALLDVWWSGVGLQQRK